MWSPVINLFNPYYATLKSIYKENQEAKSEEEKPMVNNQTALAV